MTSRTNALVVLGCSATKVDASGSIPAVHLYDGPMYRVLRSHLRDRNWPRQLSVGVLSAKYGLIGGLAPIQRYDLRMTPERADALRPQVADSLHTFARGKSQVHLVLGKDYLRAIDDSLFSRNARVTEAEGPIGMKLHHFSELLASFDAPVRSENRPEPGRGRPLYFLPDWDDFLDVDFDFEGDQFSADTREERREAHSIELMKPKRLCDGVLVSLAQYLGGGKGLLKRLSPNDPDLLRPRSVREHFGLTRDQWAFGDCGAFSYSAEHDPAVSVVQAVSIYDLYDFDFGASVDHIPLAEIVNDKGERVVLSEYERRRRVLVTRQNAAAFIAEWKRRNCRFMPVGVIQGLSAKGYADQVPEYLEMGYEYLALGGLVPKSDEDIKQVVEKVAAVIKPLRRKPWVHLLGVFRPNLQEVFRESGINSFDSATYFRKAWLRSDQNYLAKTGEWYAAIRVPPSADARTLQRLRQSGLSESDIKRMEKAALRNLRRYDAKETTLKTCLRSVLRYDALLDRGDFDLARMRTHYRRTLKDRPWTACDCNMCRDIGIDIAIFRGYNRNKRRGAHNTLQLYRTLTH
jgi:hypothetical protein